MKSVLNLTNIAASVAIALVVSAATSYAVINLSHEEKKSNYAVLDIEDAIGKTTINRLKSVTDESQAVKIVSDGRKQVEGWLSKRLSAHCSAPCVVFSRNDVVFGDVVDLNKQYELEMLNGK